MNIIFGHHCIPHTQNHWYENVRQQVICPNIFLYYFIIYPEGATETPYMYAKFLINTSVRMKIKNTFHA